jgi:hypothetical protein
MQLTTPADRKSTEGRFYESITAFLAIVVTINIVLAIAGHWRTYDWIKEFLAVVLVLHLVTVPLTIFLKTRRGITANPNLWVRTAYLWLLLATMLFNR